MTDMCFRKTEMNWITDRLPETKLRDEDEHGNQIRISEPMIVTYLEYMRPHRPTTSDIMAVYADDGNWYWWLEEGLEEVKYVPIIAWMEKPEPYRG